MIRAPTPALRLTLTSAQGPDPLHRYQTLESANDAAATLQTTLAIQNLDACLHHIEGIDENGGSDSGSNRAAGLA